MKNLYRVIILCSVLLIAFSAAASAGDWLWLVNRNPVTGNLHFVGKAGSSTPLALFGIIYNNAQKELTFSGITLGAVPENDPVLSLWNPDFDASMPGVYKVAPAGTQQNSRTIALGQFDLANAAPGLYQFELIGSATYGYAEAGELSSGDIEVKVEAVPEPASLLGLGGALLPFVAMRRRKIKV